jgi:hypothetical protein
MATWAASAAGLPIERAYAAKRKGPHGLADCAGLRMWNASRPWMERDGPGDCDDRAGHDVHQDGATRQRDHRRRVDNPQRLVDYRVAPATESAERILIKPETAAPALAAGRYAVIIKGKPSTSRSTARSRRPRIASSAYERRTARSIRSAEADDPRHGVTSISIPMGRSIGGLPLEPATVAG